MRIRRKTVQQLLLSERELEELARMITEAKEGRTVHYSECETSPGQFFGVGIAPEYDSLAPRMPERSPTGKAYK